VLCVAAEKRFQEIQTIQVRRLLFFRHLRPTQLIQDLVRQFTLAPARRGHLVLAGAAAALSIGYADLIRGGITVGPVLIVIGYAVLVPAAILTWR
jgi:hypothetical protein